MADDAVKDKFTNLLVPIRDLAGNWGIGERMQLVG
jgi:hypothetical protein